MIDQVCSSASNFLVVLLVARGAASPASFGAFTIAFGLLTFVLTASRSTLGVPLSTDLHRLGPEDARMMIARSVASGLGVGGLVSVVLVAMTALPNLDTDLRTALLALAVAAPLVVVQDIGRYVSVAKWRPGSALRSDGVWLAVILIAFSGDVAGAWDLSVASTIAWWGVGAVLGIALLLPVLAPPSVRGLRRWLIDDERRGHLFIDSVIAAGTPLLSALIVTLLASAAVLGAVRGATTLLSPLNIAISAVGLALIPDASHRSERGARRLMGLASVMLGVGALLWAGILLAVPDHVGVSLLGNIWQPAQQVLPVAAIEYVGLAAWTGAGSYLRARQQTRLQLRFRYLYAAVTLGAVLCASLVWSSAPAIAAASATAAVLVGWLAWQRILSTRVTLSAGTARR